MKTRLLIQRLQALEGEGLTGWDIDRAVLALMHFDAMKEALQECDDYLDNRADVIDGPDNRPMPNAAMSLQQRVRAVLAEIEKGQP